jgi:hypothetical protein
MANVYKDRDEAITKVMDDMHARLKRPPVNFNPAVGTGRGADLGAVDRGVRPPQPVGGFPAIKPPSAAVKKLRIDGKPKK